MTDKDAYAMALRAAVQSVVDKAVDDLIYELSDDDERINLFYLQTAAIDALQFTAECKVRSAEIEAKRIIDASHHEARSLYPSDYRIRMTIGNDTIQVSVLTKSNILVGEPINLRDWAMRKESYAPHSRGALILTLERLTHELRSLEMGKDD